MPEAGGQVPVIAVCSGKGGVGKTTVAVNVALALKDAGLRVGLVDADLYGPDAAHMMGVRRKADAAHVTVFAPKGNLASRIEAVRRHGIQLASAAFLIGEGQGLGVQAPIAQLLVQRLISSTSWEDPDCLVVDLPPGTADIQQLVFTLSNHRTLALLVVTPQVVAHRDAHRLLDALQRCRAGIVGGVENMAGQICANCGERTALFPPAPAGEAIWDKVPKLASLPFSSLAAQDADNGRPVMLTKAVAEQVTGYQQVAREIQAALGAAGSRTDQD